MSFSRCISVCPSYCTMQKLIDTLPRTHPPHESSQTNNHEIPTRKVQPAQNVEQGEEVTQEKENDESSSPKTPHRSNEQIVRKTVAANAEIPFKMS